jgi:2-aminoadipate transaminase
MRLATSRHFSSRMELVKPSAIRELLRYGADPSIISFGGGYPDAELFPVDHLDASVHTAISKFGKESLQYAVENGIARLRKQIAKRLLMEKMQTDPEDILILQGAQQGLDLVAKLFIDKGDIIVTEQPTFLGGLIAFNPYEPRYVSVPMDAEGLQTDMLEDTLKRVGSVKFLYTVPDFQNPTGVTMSLARRKHLLELADRYDFTVLEDSPYREIRYDGDAVPTLRSMDTSGRVIHLGSFSKILAPGLRLGWAVASRHLIQNLGLLKLAADTQCSTLNMYAVSLYLESYDIENHIAHIREVYKRKRDVLLETIRQTFPKEVRHTVPSGGLFTWLTFPQGFDADDFLKTESVPKARVAYVPGGTFFPDVEEANHARVSFATQPESKIVTGMTALGKLLSEHLSG